MLIQSLVLASLVHGLFAFDCSLTGDYRCNCAGNASTLARDAVEDSCAITIANWTCNDCGIRTIAPETFVDSPVIDLSLDRNAISTLDGWLEKSTRLERLSLQHNAIDGLPKYGDDVRIPIEHLDLGHNNVRRIGPDAFVGMPELIVVNLRHNRIARLTNGTFRKNARLRVLDLGGNEIATVDADTFVGLDRLDFLNLAHNRIGDVAPRTFRDLTRLVDLELQNNSLRSIRNNETSLFSDLVNLMRLNLNGNSVRRIDANDFVRNVELKYLYLQLNAIARIANGSFRTNSKLLELDLSRNRIEHLPRGIFNNLTNLNRLHLNHNRLTRLAAGVFFNLDYLRTLHVDDNRLVDFDAASLLDYAHKLQHVSLANNRWHCEYLERVLARLKSLNVNVRSGDVYDDEHVNGIRCVEEEEDDADAYETVEINVADIDKILKRIEESRVFVGSKRKNNVYVTLFINVTVNK